MTPAATAPDRGQATVELALVIPIAFVLIVGLIQMVGVIQARLMVEHATREAARALISDPSTDVFAVANAAATFDPSRLSATTTGRPISGQVVTVTVRYRVAVNLPLIGPVAQPVLQSTATVRLE